MKVYDAFLFCHELDLLEVRLKLLYDYVDYFVIQESDTTHSGKPKKLYFDEQRFAWAMGKIKRFVCNINFTTKNEFKIEEYQRTELYNNVMDISGEGDMFFFSDIDEIPDRNSYLAARNGVLRTPAIFSQDLYYYNIKNPIKRDWLGTTAMRMGDEGCDFMRRFRQGTGDYRSGWHFSYFMNASEMAQKLRSFAHASEYGKGKFQDIDRIEICRKEKLDLLEKNKGKTVLDPLPDYVLDVMKDYPLFMGEI
jgi:beta-1,4-mannosyl-glycoprotein beta-1,4-N-acetylglucosaminyltransferase